MGNTDYIEESQVENFRINGISHLFAISGMHVSFLCVILFIILGYFRVEEIKKYYITFIILMIFAFLTGFSSSVLRSVLFFFLSGINSLKRLKIDSLTILLLVLIILLLFNPSRIYSLSLRLSFIVTFFLMYYGTDKEDGYFKNLIKTSLISFLSSLPLVININYEINILSVLNNLLFVPLVSIIVYPLCLFNFVFPFLDSLTEFFINVLSILNDLCSSLSLSFIFPKFPTVLLIPYYSLLSLYKYKREKIIIYLFIIILIISYYYKKIDNNTYTYFLDVGQGDSTLIVSKYSKKTILIDTGGSINYDGKLNTYTLDSMITFFKSVGIRKIDYLLLTHGDYDHMGHAINMVENIKVKKVIFNCGEFNDLEKELIKVLDKKKITYYSCINELNIADNKLYFLNNKNYGNENDNSSVIYTEFNKIKFLFMGDAGIEVEEDLIKKYNLRNIDVLKVGHHGSKTSSGDEFINEIKPKYSVISVGKNNRYGHPNDKVLENLEDSRIYRTDQDGSILFKISNYRLNIKTCTA